ncbi:Nn.00g061750.m01.CDS01 [Neocucurbitaria sp. VM-36]
MKECSTVFADIDASLKKSRKNTLGRLMLPFRDTKIELLRNHIDKLKSTLQLLMQVLTHAHQVASKKLDREAEAKQREEIKELLENKKKSTKRYEESLRNYSASDSSTIIDNEQKLDKENEDPIPTDALTIAASAIGSTINADTLGQCVQHIRSLLEDIETLQQALEKQGEGDDHSEHHQSLIGSYFRARSHLDGVLFGSSKVSVHKKTVPAKVKDVEIGRHRTRRGSMTHAQIEEQRCLFTAEALARQSERELAEACKREERLQAVRQQQGTPGYWDSRSGNQSFATSAIGQRTSIHRQNSVSSSAPPLGLSKSNSNRRANIIQPDPPTTSSMRDRSASRSGTLADSESSKALQAAVEKERAEERDKIQRKPDELRKEDLRRLLEVTLRRDKKEKELIRLRSGPSLEKPRIDATPSQAECQAPIKFQDTLNRSYTVPFHVCNTWQGRLSPWLGNTIAPKHPAMAIPRAREEVPPPLPPPRPIKDLRSSQGQDPGWQWGNTNSPRDTGFGGNRLANVRPGSSLYSGPSGSQLRLREPSYDYVFNKGPNSSVSVSRSFDDMSSEGSREHNCDEDRSAKSRPALANYRFTSERQLGPKSLQSSSHAYDKQLLSKIGSGSKLETKSVQPTQMLSTEASRPLLSHGSRPDTSSTLSEDSDPSTAQRRRDNSRSPSTSMKQADGGLRFITGSTSTELKSKKNMTIVRKKAMDHLLKDDKKGADRSRLNSETSDMSRSSIGSQEAINRSTSQQSSTRRKHRSAADDESDVEAADGLAALRMAEEQEEADEVRRLSGGTGRFSIYTSLQTSQLPAEYVAGAQASRKAVEGVKGLTPPPPPPSPQTIPDLSLPNRGGAEPFGHGQLAGYQYHFSRCGSDEGKLPRLDREGDIVKDEGASGKQPSQHDLPEQLSDSKLKIQPVQLFVLPSSSPESMTEDEWGTLVASEDDERGDEVEPMDTMQPARQEDSDAGSIAPDVLRCDWASSDGSEGSEFQPSIGAWGGCVAGFSDRRDDGDDEDVPEEVDEKALSSDADEVDELLREWTTVLG